GVGAALALPRSAVARLWAGTRAGRASDSLRRPRGRPRARVPGTRRDAGSRDAPAPLGVRTGRLRQLGAGAIRQIVGEDKLTFPGVHPARGQTTAALRRALARSKSRREARSALGAASASKRRAASVRRPRPGRWRKLA